MANPIENATKLGQQLIEIQTKTMTDLVSMQQQNIQKYVEMTQSLTTKLPEATDPMKFMELQREAGEAMWQSIQEGNQSAAELVRSSWEEVGAAYRDAFTPDSSDS
tara:strand:+ start:940 stop:1257 length:318 start_codon:yes stop_codon:yes gene_type:complete